MVSHSENYLNMVDFPPLCERLPQDIIPPAPHHFPLEKAPRWSCIFQQQNWECHNFKRNERRGQDHPICIYIYVIMYVHYLCFLNCISICYVWLYDYVSHRWISRVVEVCISYTTICKTLKRGFKICSITAMKHSFSYVEDVLSGVNPAAGQIAPKKTSSSPSLHQTTTVQTRFRGSKGQHYHSQKKHGPYQVGGYKATLF